MLLVVARKAFGPGISIERHITVLREVGTLLKMFSLLLPRDPALNKYWSIHHLLQVESKVEILTK